MKRRLASVNTFGISSRWSDGYASVPLVPEAPLIAYCLGCNKTYWLEDATELGVVPSSDRKVQHQSGWLARLFGRKPGTVEKLAQADLFDLDFVGYHKLPRPADLLQAVLRKDWTTPEREIYLRTALWWTGNHSQRSRRTISPMSEAQATQNMLRLLELHQDAPTSSIQICKVGELLRQLRQFDAASSILDTAAGSDAAASAILAAARREEAEVFLLEAY